MRDLFPDKPPIKSVSYVPGLRLVANPKLVEKRYRLKTFLERWLSIPWRPWEAVVYYEEPREGYERLENNQVVGHPATIDAIRRGIGIVYKKGPGDYQVKELGGGHMVYIYW